MFKVVSMIKKNHEMMRGNEGDGGSSYATEDEVGRE
jgi:hypothetical protein